MVFITKITIVIIRTTTTSQCGTLTQGSTWWTGDSLSQCSRSPYSTTENDDDDEGDCMRILRWWWLYEDTRMMMIMMMMMNVLFLSRCCLNVPEVHTVRPRMILVIIIQGWLWQDIILILKEYNYDDVGKNDSTMLTPICIRYGDTILDYTGSDVEVDN